MVLPSDTLLIKTVTRDSDSYIVPCLDGIAGSWYLPPSLNTISN